MNSERCPKDMLHNLLFFASPHGYVLWKNADQITADSMKQLDALVQYGIITYRRTSAGNLSIRVLKNNAEQQERFRGMRCDHAGDCSEKRNTRSQTDV